MLKPTLFGPYQHRVLFVVGIGMAVDGMMMFVISLILPELPAAWGLDGARRGMLGGVVFLGMAIGAPLCGALSDLIGRLTSTGATLAFALSFGLACAASSGFWMLLALEFAFGVGVGGFIPVGNTLLLEQSPADATGHSIGLAMNLFSIGGTAASVAAGYVLPACGWQVLLVFAASPLAVPLLALPCLRLVESPTWLHSKGRSAEAVAALQHIDRMNGTTEAAPAARTERPHDDQPSDGRGRPSLLSIVASVEGARLTLSLSLLWGCMSFAYYGIVFLWPTWVDADGHVPRRWSYPAISATALAEVPGNFLAGYCCDRFGRRPSLTAFFAASACLFLACGLASDAIDRGELGWPVELMLVCLLKTFITAPFTSLYIFTPEAFPTHVRNFALGLSSVVTRIGGTFTPMVGQILLESFPSALPTFEVYALTCTVGTLAAAALPFESLGRDADDYMPGGRLYGRGELQVLM